MKVLSETKITFRGEGALGDPATLEVQYDNRGEPYRRGLSLYFMDGHHAAGVFLEVDEAKRLRDLIDKLYPRKP